LPLNNSRDHDYQTFQNDLNYKKILVQILCESKRLENGELFKSCCISPVELSALASYNNIIATGNHNKNHNINNNNNVKSNNFITKNNVFTHAHTASGQIIY
jgi:hypothetical protein